MRLLAGVIRAMFLMVYWYAEQQIPPLRCGMTNKKGNKFYTMRILSSGG
jgi:hypothetical protein